MAIGARFADRAQPRGHGTQNSLFGVSLTDADLARQLKGPAIQSDDKHLRALPPRSARTSRGSIAHNLPGGVRLRESAGSIELLGEARDDALEQLVTVAKQRFGTKPITLLGTRSAQERLAQLAEQRGLEIAQERQR